MSHTHFLLQPLMTFIHLYHVGMITGFSELLAFFLNFLFPEITLDFSRLHRVSEV